MMKRLFTFISITISALGFGQRLDTSLLVSEVVITADTLIYSDTNGSKSHAMLDEAIITKGAFFIKDHGASGIATISHRGGNASQTEVIWNGVPINNPMLGLTDLSILNRYLLDEAILGNSGLMFSGLTGTLDLKTNIPKRSNIDIYNSFGSFGRRVHGVGGALAKGKFSGGIRLVTTVQENDFKYKYPDETWRKMMHAAFKQNGATGQLQYKTDKLLITFDNLYTDSYREIAPTTRQIKSTSNQNDFSFKKTVGMIRILPKGLLSLKYNHGEDRITYRDPSIALISNARVYSQYCMAKYASNFYNQWGWEQSLVINANKVNNDGYRTSQSQVRYSINEQAYYKWKKGISILNLGVKGDDIRQFVIGGISNQWMLWKQIVLSGGLQRDVRIPTTNERFWAIGGNPALRPERAIKGNLDFKLESPSSHLQLQCYWRETKDWILWSKREQQSFFSVQNIGLVRSVGVEIQHKYMATLGSKINYSTYTSLHIGKSQNRTAINVPIIKLGDQLFYTPKLQANHFSQIVIGNFELNTTINYVGSTIGITGNIKGYLISGVGLKWGSGNKRRIDLSYRIQNVLNHQYEVVEYTPMIGRAHYLDIKFLIH